MRKEYLSQMLDTLQKEVPSLRWIDADEGQLDFYTDDRPPVAFPCCLVDFAMPEARNLSVMGTVAQRCTLRAVLQVAFHDNASLNTKTPKPVRETAMKRFDVLESITAALNGRFFDGFMQPYTRVSCMPRKRDDGLKMYELVFEAAVVESRAVGTGSETE
ncbi:MAG TPA: hypothetical protein H9752_07940 [Candidatus Phocaeicola excrementigallinarum]|nr:hypothetical protein [Candidatus Phocaeicola excrementigallinarum]